MQENKKIPKILIVDDDSTVHMSFDLLAESFLIELVKAKNKSEALELIEKDPSQFVITFIDHSLQKLDGSVELGVDLVPKLKNLNPYMPVTMMSCLLYTSPSPRDQRGSRMPSSA